VVRVDAIYVRQGRSLRYHRNIRRGRGLLLALLLPLVLFLVVIGGRFWLVGLSPEELHQIAEGPHGLFALLHGIGDRDERFGFGFEFMRAALTGTLRPRSARGRTTIPAATIVAGLAAGAAFTLLPAALLRSTGLLRSAALIGPAALGSTALRPSTLRPDALLIRLTALLILLIARRAGTSALPAASAARRTIALPAPALILTRLVLT